MFILKYKRLDSQTAIGMGYVTTDAGAPITAGGLEAWGMNCELIKQSDSTYMTDQNHHVQLFGIEDFWGNIYEWIDGIVTSSSHEALTANNNFNDTGAGYINNGNVSISTVTMLKVPYGTTKLGFILDVGGGSTNTYFCDNVSTVSDRNGVFGGRYGNGLGAGIFSMYIDTKYSDGSSIVGVRLMYL